MTEKENKIKAFIVIQYIMRIFREECIAGSSHSPNVELFLSLMEQNKLINIKSGSSAKNYNDMLNETFFKNITELLALESGVDPLKRYEVEKEIESLMKNRSLLSFFCDLVKTNELPVREFSEKCFEVSKEYLKTLESIFYSKYIKGKQDAFESFNVQLMANFNKNSKKRR